MRLYPVSSRASLAIAVLGILHARTLGSQASTGIDPASGSVFSVLVHPPRGTPIGPAMALEVSGMSGGAAGTTPSPTAGRRSDTVREDLLWVVLPAESSVARWLLGHASRRGAPAPADTAFTLEIASARTARERGMRFTAENCVVRDATIALPRPAASGRMVRVTIAHRGLTWAE